MGYPTGVQSFTTKQDGVDYPQASHINDLQTEVTALENGLLNGLQHTLTISTGGLTVSTGSVNISGPSTLATLSAGASTLASLSVSGNSTFTGSATFSSGVTFSTVVTFHANQTFGATANRIPAVKVTHSTNQNVANAAWTGLSWDAETYDADGLHSTASNSSRLNLTSTGIWHLSCGVEWNNGSSGQTHVRIRLNDGNTTLGAQSTPQYEPNGQGAVVHAVYLATSTTDYVTVMAYQASGSTRSIAGAGSTGFGGSWFSAMRVSA